MLIATCGGAMFGYCWIGSRNTDSPPANISTIASTQANTGLSMKNCEITYELSALGYAGRGVGVGRRPLRRNLHGLHLGTRPDLLHSIEDHAVPGFQAVADQPVVADRARGRYDAFRNDVVATHQQHHGVALLVARDAALRHEQRVALHGLRQLRTHEHAGQQLSTGVRKQRAQQDGARALVYGHLGELQLAVLGVPSAVFERQADLRLVLLVAL